VKIAFIIFNNMTALDFIGFYDPVTRLKSMGFLNDLEWEIVAFVDKIKDDRGLTFIPVKIRTPLEDYDMIFIPGGFGTRTLINDNNFINWLQTSANVKIKVSVCTGSLLLGKAGFLKDKRATTHPNAFNDLKVYCREVVDSRIVDEGNIITAGGVTSSIDLGLYLVNKIAGEEIKNKIAAQVDYPYKY
jgi:transcriptional regulator GlxA family with amidase domain